MGASRVHGGIRQEEPSQEGERNEPECAAKNSWKDKFFIYKIHSNIKPLSEGENKRKNQKLKQNYANGIHRVSRS